MSRVLDNVLAFRVLSMLVTPFEATDAFRLGIIDEKGNNLIKASKLQTTEQKDAYNYLTRLVFNLKRLLMKLPGGDTKIKNLVAALWLVKESYQDKKQIQENDFNRIIKLVDSGVVLVEEEITVEKFVEENKQVEEDAPANATGAGVSTDAPVAKKSDIDKYKSRNASTFIALTRRNKVIQ